MISCAETPYMLLSFSYNLKDKKKIFPKSDTEIKKLLSTNVALCS